MWTDLVHTYMFLLASQSQIEAKRAFGRIGSWREVTTVVRSHNRGKEIILRVSATVTKSHYDMLIDPLYQCAAIGSGASAEGFGFAYVGWQHHPREIEVQLLISELWYNPQGQLCQHCHGS